MLDISILVPVMNEAGNIRPLIGEICTAMAGRQFEIIYVDDASDDATAEELFGNTWRCAAVKSASSY